MQVVGLQRASRLKINPNSEQTIVASRAPEPVLNTAPVPQSEAAGVDVTQEPFYWDGVTWPRALSAEMRQWSPEKLSAYAVERHAVKGDPMLLGRILGFDFQPIPHAHLFRDIIIIPPVKEDGIAPPISTIDPQHRKSLILWSRGVFKTSAVVVVIVQIVLNYPDTRILFMTGNDQLAKNQLARIKRFFEKPTAEFLRLFPEFCLTSKYDKRHKKWVDLQLPLGSAKKFTVPCRSTDVTAAEPTVAIFTTKGTKSGAHAPWIFCDDLVNDINSRNPRMLDAVWNQYLDICPILDPVGKMILTGTRYSFDDTYERIERKAHEDGEDSIWKISCKSCWDWGCLNCSHMESEHDYSTNILQPKCGHGDCIGFAKDRTRKGVLFPRTTTRKGEAIGWTIEFLEKTQRDMGAGPFANQYENRPLAEENQQFTETMLGKQTLHSLSAPFPQRNGVGVRTYALADLAYSESEDSDLSVIICFYVYQGQIWIFDIICGHWGSAQLVANVFKVMLRPDVRPDRFFIEKNLAWENLQELLKANARTLNLPILPIEFIGGMSNNKKGAKAQRIMAIQQMLVGNPPRLWLYGGMEHYQTLVNQLCKFPRGGKHGDDLADCLAMCCESPCGWALDNPPATAQSGWNAMKAYLGQHNHLPDDDGASMNGTGTYGPACGGPSDESWK
jgi:hypothetical protein